MDGYFQNEILIVIRVKDLDTSRSRGKYKIGLLATNIISSVKISTVAFYRVKCVYAQKPNEKLIVRHKSDTVPKCNAVTQCNDTTLQGTVAYSNPL